MKLLTVPLLVALSTTASAQLSSPWPDDTAPPPADASAPTSTEVRASSPESQQAALPKGEDDAKHVPETTARIWPPQTTGLLIDPWSADEPPHRKAAPTDTRVARPSQPTANQAPTWQVHTVDEFEEPWADARPPLAPPPARETLLFD